MLGVFFSINFEAQQLDLRSPTLSYQVKNFEQELFIFSDAGQKPGLPDVAQQLNASFENPERLKNTKDLIHFDRLLGQRKSMVFHSLGLHHLVGGCTGPCYCLLHLVMSLYVFSAFQWFCNELIRVLWKLRLTSRRTSFVPFYIIQIIVQRKGQNNKRHGGAYHRGSINDSCPPWC